MKFHKFDSTHDQARPCSAAQIDTRQTLYMQEEGHHLYSIGLVEFRATRRPQAGEWVVYISGETAFLMTDAKFTEQYGGTA